MFVGLLACVGAEGADNRFRPEADTARLQQRGWRKVGSPDPSSLIELTVAVRQQNLDRLEQTAMGVSDPRSSTYGEHLSHEVLSNLVAPLRESVAAVQKWLNLYTQTSADTSGEFFVAQVSVQTAELMLQTKVKAVLLSRQRTHLFFVMAVSCFPARGWTSTSCALPRLQHPA